MTGQDTILGSDVPKLSGQPIEPRLANSEKLSLEVAMTIRPYAVYGALFILGCGVSCVDVVSAQAQPDEEQVTVESPYTIRQQVVQRAIHGEMQQTRISVDQNVSYADLDLSKAADLDTMKDRIRQAAKDSCSELDRRFPRTTYIPVADRNCVNDAENQAFARLDEIKPPVR
jgi:UrcA family protein